MEKIEETTNCSSTMEKQNQIETETNNEGENKKTEGRCVMWREVPRGEPLVSLSVLRSVIFTGPAFVSSKVERIERC